MKADLIKKIEKDFPKKEIEQVLALLDSINLDEHLPGQGQEDLDKTLVAILQLADGKMEKVKELTMWAKRDFRNVMMWYAQSLSEQKDQ